VKIVKILGKRSELQRTLNMCVNLRTAYVGAGGNQTDASVKLII
jgi:hypothetical protein